MTNPPFIRALRARPVLALSVALLALTVALPAEAQVRDLSDFDPLGPDNLTVSLKLLALLTILSLAPSIILLTTAFPRIVIVLGFVRRALSTQEVPPNQVIIGLALILTFMVMAPTFNAIHRDSLQPYLDGDLINYL